MLKLGGEEARDQGLAVKQDAILSRGKNKFVQIHFERIK